MEYQLLKGFTSFKIPNMNIEMPRNTEIIRIVFMLFFIAKMSMRIPLLLIEKSNNWSVWFILSKVGSFPVFGRRNTNVLFEDFAEM